MRQMIPFQLDAPHLRQDRRQVLPLLLLLRHQVEVRVVEARLGLERLDRILSPSSSAPPYRGRRALPGASARRAARPVSKELF